PLPDYQLDTSFGAQMLAPGADPDTGPAFMLAGGASPEGLTAADLLDMLKSDEVILSEPQPITVDGHEGLVADIQQTSLNLSGRVVAVMVTPQQQFVLFGVAPQAQWDAEISPLFETLLGSVKLFEMQAPAEPANLPTEEPAAELTEIRQWANSATASSEYGSSNWAAYQATGAPSVTTCGDNSDAWAASSSSTVEWLELTFDVPVEPTQVNVYISYNPTFITKMELIDAEGVSHQIYGFEARSYPECPTIFSVDITEIGFQAATLRITIDQTTSPSWVEIDAVELVGMGDASLISSPPGEEPPPPVADFETPAGFLWRAGGEEAFDTLGVFPGLSGIDVDPNNNLVYLADTIYNIQIVDALTSEYVGQFKHAEMRVPQDVKVDALGNVYVAAWGSGKVLVFPPRGDGEPYSVFGERGKGDGQFGDFSPTHLAVGLDGRIYVHDSNKNDKDEYINRIQVFTPQGQWLQTINFEDKYFSPGGMDVGPDGNLYVVGFIGSKILKYSPDGELLGELGEDAIRNLVGGAQGLAIDDAGNFYVAMWTSGMIKLDPEGNLLGQWGVQVNDGENDWPAGGFYQPAGISMMPDGSIVYFSDSSTQYSYLTAFTFTP
ncbi:MAG TPA: hypothetical protein DEH22_01035, partial [Chloroflexi bacterium]|nr:hypothetical protein [Chloroflexota bacterium]